MAFNRENIIRLMKRCRKAGGFPNGEPGERQYVKGYYAAFVIDPVGNNIEVMYWSPWWMKAFESAPYALAALTGAGLSYAAAKYLGS